MRHFDPGECSGIGSSKRLGPKDCFSPGRNGKKLKYTYLLFQPIYQQKRFKQYFQRLCANLKLGINISGGWRRGGGTRITSPMGYGYGSPTVGMNTTTPKLLYGANCTDNDLTGITIYYRSYMKCVNFDN